MTTNNLLDEGQIVKRRIPISEVELNLDKKAIWVCNYCTRRFVNETSYMNHYCKQKNRALELKSTIGQSAYMLYCQWMKGRKYSQQPIDTFAESKYYRSFINFAKFIISSNISNPDKYIELMINNKILPVLWCRNSIYSIYLDWVDKKSDPLDEVQRTVNFLFDLCEKKNIEINNVFNELGAQEVLSLIRQKALSPWLLFSCQTFGKFLKTLDSEQLKILNSLINAVFWADRFSKNKEIIENIKLIAKEVNL